MASTCSAGSFHLWANGTSGGGYGVLRHVTLSHCRGGEGDRGSTWMWPTDVHTLTHHHPPIQNYSNTCKNTCGVLTTTCFIIPAAFLLNSHTKRDPFWKTITTTQADMHTHSYKHAPTYYSFPGTPPPQLPNSCLALRDDEKVHLWGWGSACACVYVPVFMCVCVFACTLGRRSMLLNECHESRTKSFHSWLLFLINKGGGEEGCWAQESWGANSCRGLCQYVTKCIHACVCVSSHKEGSVYQSADLSYPRTPPPPPLLLLSSSLVACCLKWRKRVDEEGLVNQVQRERKLIKKSWTIMKKEEVSERIIKAER